MNLKILTLFLLIFSGLVLNANSQWTNNTAVNNVICDTTGDQATPKIASLSDGGCYIVWFDQRNGNYSVYLQRTDAAGNKLFGSQGLLISGNTQSSSLQDFDIDVDASDNIVITFTDRRNGTILNPFAYLISKTGGFLWGPNGVSLTDSITVNQAIPSVAATSDGNYVFAWDYLTSPRKIAMQRLDANGNPQWGSAPKKIRGSVSENLDYPNLVKSDAGSVIMCWDNYLGSISTSSTIKLFTQKFAPDGSNLWTTPYDTVQNIGKMYGISGIPSLISDGNNGAVYSWVDDRNFDNRASVWCQRFSSAGVPQFPKNGSEGSTLAANNHFSPSVAFLQPTQETVLFWHETNAGQTVQGGLYGQRFNSTGTQQWGASGMEFKALDNNALSFISAYSKDTNVIVSYTESITGGGNALVKAMRTGPSGTFYWPGNIVTASSALGSKIRKQAVLDRNSGNSVMVWSTGNIMGQNIKFNGEPGVCSVSLKFSIEGFWNSPVQISDTVRSYLHNSVSPFNIIDSGKVYLNTNGEGVVSFAYAPSGNYYLSVKHRNSLETWSAASMSILKGSNSYDFTTAASQAYGNNLILKDGRYCNYSGDVNQDETVDAADLSQVENGVSLGLTGYIATDVNGDDIDDASDLSIVENNVAIGPVVLKP